MRYDYRSGGHNFVGRVQICDQESSKNNRKSFRTALWQLRMLLAWHRGKYVNYPWLSGRWGLPVLVGSWVASTYEQNLRRVG